ncbi:PRC-barrel domain-containing protein [Chloroflexota bacterium]
MQTVKEQLNKQVIAISNGKKLGKIKEIYFDPDVTKVAGVSLGSSGIFKRKDLMIDGRKVQKCGMDAWLVSSSDVVVEPKQIFGSSEFVPASELQDREIVSEGGTEIATVDSTIIDEHGNVKGFTLDKLPESGPLAQRKAIARGAIHSLGSETSPMTTTLEVAESILISPSPSLDL